MENYVMCLGMLEEYRMHLVSEEKSPATIEKYIRDVRAFYETLDGGQIDKEVLVRYKERLLGDHAVSSVNSILISIHGFLKYKGWEECRVKLLKVQRNLFCSQEKMLTKEEYLRLLDAAKKRPGKRLYYILQTLCATGIRVSELRYITLYAVRRGKTEVNCKGKIRVILLPQKLCGRLLEYARENGIREGSLFVTKRGNVIDRSNLWKEMKNLCGEAGVQRGKVFPHNLRHLFARTYYKKEKDISGLADLLGHSSIDTTRIYMVSTGQKEHRRINLLGLVV